MWDRVTVVAQPGTEFGVYKNVLDGCLILVCRRPGEPWPKGYTPAPESVNTIAPDRTQYTVAIEED